MAENDGGFRISLQHGDDGPSKLPSAERRVPRLRTAQPTLDPKAIARSLKRTPGAAAVIDQVPGLADAFRWNFVASFSVCQKAGTASFLDIWNNDHFDGYTDMQRDLSNCKVWFSGDGFTFWGSPETKSGVVNCYFRAPSAGPYVCNAQLESWGGAALVECFIDSSSFGGLPVNGSINQPHPCNLTAGFHHFTIKQRSGAFFFVSLTVWAVPVIGG